MGLFDDQIKQRVQLDDEAFENAFAQMADVLMGKKMVTALENDCENTKDAVYQILKYYHVKPVELPNSIVDLNDQLEYLMRPAGIMQRYVNLEGDWYKNAVGAFLGTLESDGSVVALLPDKISGYCFLDKKTGMMTKLNKKTASLFN